MQADVIIIGGGVVGSSIARELSRFQLKIVLLEKEDDVAMGTSKANSGIIHAGYNAPAGSLMGKLNARSNPAFDQLCQNLKVPFKRIGSLVIGFNRGDLQVLKEEKMNGEKLGIPGLRILDRAELQKMEAEINPRARYALYAPTAGIISPYKLTIGLAENAVINGVKLFLNTEVNEIMTTEDRVDGVKTNRGIFQAPIIVNASGLYADRLSHLAGEEEFQIKARKGEYHLLDRKCDGMVKHILFPMPAKNTKGILVTPTVDGNILLGPTSREVEDKSDVSTTSQGLKQVYSGASKLVPALDLSRVITSFAGNRAVAGSDFIIKPASKIIGLIQVAGIKSPGLSSSPAIARLVREIVRDMITEIIPGFDFKTKPAFRESLPAKPHFAELYEKGRLDEWNRLVRDNPELGEIVCRCEKVSRGEIIEALHRPVPVTSLDGVKRRTRAGGGRCQGGFCSYRILKIISEEMGLNPLKVSKKGSGSEVLLANAKELINTTKPEIIINKNYDRAGDQDETQL